MLSAINSMGASVAKVPITTSKTRHVCSTNQRCKKQIVRSGSNHLRRSDRSRKECLSKPLRTKVVIP